MNIRKSIPHSSPLPRLCHVLVLAAAVWSIATPTGLKAQTAGEGTITGTVTDSTGAAIPNATVTAINVATNVSTQRTSSSSGLYTIAPLPPGTYSVSVTGQAASRPLTQDNL